jgi:thiamine biosynthesis lipoprotein
MFLVGLPAGQEHWPVALEDPLEPGAVLTALKAGPGAVATSAVTKRTWKQGEITRHHLIDPRTGEPAVTDWLSVTVIAPHADAAEVYAKALLIAGSQGAEQVAGNSPAQIHYLAVDHDKNIWGSQKSLELVHVS